MPRITFTATKKEFELLPSGNALGVIQAVELGTSQKNNPKLTITWSLPLGEGGGNRKLWETISLLPESGWKIKKLLEILDVPHVAVNAGTPHAFNVEFDTDDLVGKQTILSVGQETFTSNRLDASGQPIRGIRNCINDWIKMK